MDTRKLLLKSLNAHITCYICKGYLVDATTVIDCLHTFCKSCLLKHFDENDNCCPKCENLIHQSHPSHYVSFDRTMQDIVYKLVPDMQKEERQRRAQFNKANGIADDDDDDEVEEEAAQSSVEPVPTAADPNLHREDEQVSVCLTPDSPIKRLKRSYIRLSSQATIIHLKKYLAKKLFFDMSRYADIDILCNSELMGKDHSLKFIQLTRWRTKGKDEPMQLMYRKHVDF
uniref:RING-type domain-containing protein n=1 Tax=Plectus sambesii TaxID=2011161 RepID=A0A914XMW2_9BILA